MKAADEDLKNLKTFDKKEQQLRDDGSQKKTKKVAEGMNGNDSDHAFSKIRRH